MNIFLLDKDPETAAQMQCDKHVVKMTLESAQLLCSPFNQGDAPYRRTHYSHPCSKWCRESGENYRWLLKHSNGLANEYTHRYGKVHKSQSVIQWCDENYQFLNLPEIHKTSFALAMPEQYKCIDPVRSYRNYYNGEKSGFAKWTNREIPKWFETNELTDFKGSSTLAE